MQTHSAPSSLPPLAPAPWAVARPVSADHGVTGEVLLLGPRAERSCEALPRARTFYVAAGEITASVGATNHILAADAVLTIPAGRAATLRNHAAEPAKVLSLALPAPRVEWRLFVPEDALPASA